MLLCRIFPQAYIQIQLIQHSWEQLGISPTLTGTDQHGTVVPCPLSQLDWWRYGAEKGNNFTCEANASTERFFLQIPR